MVLGLVIAAFFLLKGDSEPFPDIEHLKQDVYVDDSDGFPDLSLAGAVDRENDGQLLEAIERLQRRRVMHSSAQ